VSKSILYATARRYCCHKGSVVAMIFPLPIGMPVILVAGNVVIGGIYIVGELQGRVI